MLWLVMLAWPLFLLNRGIDVSDISYSLANYKYAFSDRGFTTISTMLTAAVGGGLYGLLPSHQQLGIHIGGWVLYVCFLLLSHWILKRFLPEYLLLPLLLAGSMVYKMSIIFLGYNALSFTTLLLGCALVMRAMETNSIKLSAVAGLVLGTNIFFRLPNLLHLGLVVILFWYHFFCCGQKKRAFQSCAVFLGAGGLAALFWLVIGFLWLGGESVFGVLLRTTNLAVSAGSSYNLLTMVKNVLLGWWTGLQTAKSFIGIELLLMLGAGLFFSHFSIKKRWPLAVIFIGFLLAGFYGGRWLFYVSLMSMTAVIGMLLGIVGTFYFRKRAPLQSAVCAIVVFVIVVIPLGTNNGMYHYTVMFPFVLAGCITVIYLLFQEVCQKMTLSPVWPGFPGALFLGLCLVVGTRDGVPFIYRDSPLQELTASVEIPVFRGMKTTPQRAQTLEEIYQDLMPFYEWELAYIGQFAAGAIISEMQPFFEKAWVDLESYPMEAYGRCIERKTEAGIYPVILIVDMDLTGTYRDPQKVQMLLDLVDRENYILYKNNERYQIYLPPTAIAAKVAK